MNPTGFLTERDESTLGSRVGQVQPWAFPLCGMYERSNVFGVHRLAVCLSGPTAVRSVRLVEEEDALSGRTGSGQDAPMGS